MFSAKTPVESGIVRTYWNDGLLDILSGMGVLLIGIAWLCDLPVMGAIAPPLLIPLWKPLRNKLTDPRLGSVEFSDRQETRNRSFMIFSMAAGLLSCLLAVVVYFRVSQADSEFDLRRVVQALPAILLGIMAFMTARITSLSRFDIYAVALIILGCSSGLLQTGPAWPLVIGGTLILLSGVLALQQFLGRTRTCAVESQESKSDV